MKTCPRCGKQYTEPGINFCLEDGELLSHLQEIRDPSLFADDQPPTAIMDSTRATRETNWPTMDPSCLTVRRWSSFRTSRCFRRSRRAKIKLFRIVSMALGIASLIFVCATAAFGSVPGCGRRLSGDAKCRPRPFATAARGCNRRARHRDHHVCPLDPFHLSRSSGIGIVNYLYSKRCGLL